MSSPPVPERRHTDLPAVGGVFKASPADFVVIERPLYEPSGVGDHTYLRIRKTGLTTDEALRRIGRALGRRPRDLGFAGRKDRHAVTEQTISIEHVEPEAAAEQVADLDDIDVLSVSRHRNKLRLGHLAGNRFELVVRDTEPGAVERARALLERVVARGCPNAFGAQRFGRRGDNHEIGRELVRGDAAKAVELLIAGGGRDGARLSEARERGTPAERSLRRLSKSQLRLLVSAYQSALFNRLLERRLVAYDTVEVGDLAYLHDRGAVFLVEDEGEERKRAACFEISATGPLFGSRMSAPSGRPSELEAPLLTDDGLYPAHFARTLAGSFRGERRPLRVPVTDATAEAVPEDENAVRLTFSLPRGSYATTVLHELGVGSESVRPAG